MKRKVVGVSTISSKHRAYISNLCCLLFEDTKITVCHVVVPWKATTFILVYKSNLETNMNLKLHRTGFPNSRNHFSEHYWQHALISMKEMFRLQISSVAHVAIVLTFETTGQRPLVSKSWIGSLCILVVIYWIYTNLKVHKSP